MSTFGDRVYQSGGIPVGGDVLGNMGDGKVIFLDPGLGNDANGGTNPYTDAVATLARAVALSEKDFRGDVIVRLPGTETPTAAIVVNKSGLLVMAATSAAGPPAGRGAGGEYYLTNNATVTDAAVVSCYKKRISWVGLGFQGVNTAADKTGAALLFDHDSGEPGFNYVISCEFPGGVSNNSGVFVNGANHMYIARNIFGGASGTLPNGVVFAGSSSNNPVNDIVEDNVFGDVTIGIWFKDGTPQDLLIAKNYFTKHGTADIDFDGMAAGGSGFIAGNYFSGSVSTAVDSITGGTDTVTGVIGDTAFEFAGNNYLET